MTFEPFINKKTGEISWFDSCPLYLDRDVWVEYADFEREKLKACGVGDRWPVELEFEGFMLHIDGRWVNSVNLIDYSTADYKADSESNRIIKRAEFLKAVCKMMGVEWLPAETKRVVQLFGGYRWITQNNSGMYTRNQIDERFEALLGILSTMRVLTAAGLQVSFGEIEAKINGAREGFLRD